MIWDVPFKYPTYEIFERKILKKCLNFSMFFNAQSSKVGLFYRHAVFQMIKLFEYFFWCFLWFFCLSGGGNHFSGNWARCIAVFCRAWKNTLIHTSRRAILIFFAQFLSLFCQIMMMIWLKNHQKRAFFGIQAAWKREKAHLLNGRAGVGLIFGRVVAFQIIAVPLHKFYALIPIFGAIVGSAYFVFINMG